MPSDLQLVPVPAGSGTPPEAGGAIRVVLADNHAAMRRSLRLLLDGEEKIDVVAEAEDLSALIRQMRHHRPQVLVLDLGMHNGSSIEVLRQLRGQVPGSEIVVLTMEESPAFARRAIDAGAIGFVLKDRADSELSPAVRSAAHGEEYISPYVSAGLDSLRRGAGDDRPTPSEIEILRLAALDHSGAGRAGSLER